ncbi:MAG: SDR family oxidoreductase [Bacillota bacterium]
MKLLIIGASSFIGSNMFECAIKSGYNVIGTCYSNCRREFIKYNILENRIVEVLDKSFNTNNRDNAYAIICSGIGKIDDCFKYKEISYKINVEKMMQLIDDLTYLGYKVVFLSSEAVFDGQRGYYNELSPVSPINEYGRQKVQIENYILDRYSQHLVFRLGVVVGDYHPQRHLLSVWYKSVLDNTPIRCIEGQIFSPTYVQDISDAILLALDKNLSGLYHLANQEFFQRDELARQFLYAMNRQVDIIVEPMNKFGFVEKRSLKTYLDSSKFTRETNFNYTSMREVFEIFLKNQNWPLNNSD